MRTLHVAALPYPSPQGTQGLLHAMLSALSCAGHDTHLLCYAHGSAQDIERPYHVHRLRRSLGESSLRSGPSARKLGLDMLLAHRLRALVRTLRPERVFAHHVEAALACHAGRVRHLFVAHTSLEHELPGYFSGPWASCARPLGAALERALCRRAERSLAVSPLLASLLSAAARVDVRALPIPWSVPEPTSGDERASARAEFGFGPEERVLLYAGNLDAYQGLDVLAEAVARLSRIGRWRWLVATESAPEALGRLPREALGVLRLSRLRDERDRRLVHAAADAVAIPRASPGGVPIKLLDALARGAPTVATRRATAGLAVQDACQVIADDAPSAFVRACLATSRDAPYSPVAARDYIRREHAPARFVAALTAPLSARP